MSIEQAKEHLANAKRYLNEPKPFSPDGYDPVQLARFDYRDDFAWTFYRGDIYSAISELQKAIAINPNLLDAQSLLANLYVIQNQFTQAIMHYQQAIKIDESNLLLKLNLAVTLDQIGNENEAKATYQSLKDIAQFPFPWLLDFLTDRNKNATALLDTQLEKETDNQSKNLLHKIKQYFQNQTGCTLCGSTDFSEYYQNPKTKYPVVQCVGCGVYFVFPQPDETEINRKYEPSYFAPFLADAEKLFKLWKEWRSTGKMFSPTGKQFSLVLAWLNSLGLKEYATLLGSNRKMLDIGCATCGLMAEMVNCGWTAQGIELTPEIIKFDKKMGFEVFQGPIEQVPYSDASFGLVTMTHVIEHLPNPKRTLQKVSRILMPKGKLFIRTPNCDSFPRLIAGKDWFSDPDHLFFFGTKTLTKLLTDCGFRILGIKNYVGIDMETYSEVWNNLGLNDIIRARFNQYNLGDVALVYAEKR
jgi:2-polyprenyl-3-methyl-5-hydroxy-6-metoxy-1,4-benzoquinol methylase